MSRVNFLGIVAAAVACSLSNQASAAVVSIDFEGLGNNVAINDYYNGNGGPNHGIVFENAVSLIDSDVIGALGGNFENEPSPNTIMFFTAESATMNVAAGFSTALSFYYTSVSETSKVEVYDAVGGTGNVLATINLAALGGLGCSQAIGEFCNWDVGVATFAGLAKSVVFTSTAANPLGQVGFDDLTFGSRTPGGNRVPEPAPLLLLGLALSGLALQRRAAR